MSEIKFIKLPTSDKENSNKYLLKNSEQELGYAYIYLNNSINNIYFFINPKFRSNGFGFLLCSLVLKEVKNTTNLSQIELNIEKSNSHANNIIAKCGGLVTSEDSLKHWIIKI